MGKPRNWYTYDFKVGHKVKHGGITQNLEQREKQLQQKWPGGHIKQVGGPKTEEGARNWEKEQDYS